MIETLEGAKNAYEIAKVPGVTAIFAASGDLGNFSGFAQGTPDYERLINIVQGNIRSNWLLLLVFACCSWFLPAGRCSGRRISQHGQRQSGFDSDD